MKKNFDKAFIIYMVFVGCVVLFGLLMVWHSMYDPTPKPAEFHITVDDEDYLGCRYTVYDTFEFNADEGKLIVYIRHPLYE